MSFKTLLGATMLAAAVIGCAPPAATAPKAVQTTAAPDPKVEKKDDHDDNVHGAHGPHDGTIVDFGAFHAEFCMDHAKKEATVYILDEEVKKPVPIAVETILLSIEKPAFQVDLKAAPIEGDPKGMASRFVAAHENFGKEQEFAGTMSAVIDGKPSLGDFKEEAHDEHDHEHEKKK
ncbi:MAG: hypothetical protein ACRDD1_17905 [Planctomycetia bacterium]